MLAYHKIIGNPPSVGFGFHMGTAQFPYNATWCNSEVPRLAQPDSTARRWYSRELQALGFGHYAAIHSEGVWVGNSRPNVFTHYASLVGEGQAREALATDLLTDVSQLLDFQGFMDIDTFLKVPATPPEMQPTRFEPSAPAVGQSVGLPAIDPPVHAALLADFWQQCASRMLAQRGTSAPVYVVCTPDAEDVQRAGIAFLRERLMPYLPRDVHNILSCSFGVPLPRAASYENSALLFIYPGYEGTLGAGGYDLIRREYRPLSGMDDATAIAMCETLLSGAEMRLYEAVKARVGGASPILADFDLAVSLFALDGLALDTATQARFVQMMERWKQCDKLLEERYGCSLAERKRLLGPVMEQVLTCMRGGNFSIDRAGFMLLSALYLVKDSHTQDAFLLDAIKRFLAGNGLDGSKSLAGYIAELSQPALDAERATDILLLLLECMRLDTPLAGDELEALTAGKPHYPKPAPHNDRLAGYAAAYAQKQAGRFEQALRLFRVHCTYEDTLERALADLERRGIKEAPPQAETALLSGIVREGRGPGDAQRTRLTGYLEKAVYAHIADEGLYPFLRMARDIGIGLETVCPAVYSALDRYYGGVLPDAREVLAIQQILCDCPGFDADGALVGYVCGLTEKATAGNLAYYEWLDAVGNGALQDRQAWLAGQMTAYFMRSNAGALPQEEELSRLRMQLAKVNGLPEMRGTHRRIVDFYEHHPAWLTAPGAMEAQLRSLLPLIPDWDRANVRWKSADSASIRQAFLDGLARVQDVRMLTDFIERFERDHAGQNVPLDMQVLTALSVCCDRCAGQYATPGEYAQAFGSLEAIAASAYMPALRAGFEKSFLASADALFLLSTGEEALRANRAMFDQLRLLCSPQRLHTEAPSCAALQAMDVYETLCEIAEKRLPAEPTYALADFVGQASTQLYQDMRLPAEFIAGLHRVLRTDIASPPLRQHDFAHHVALFLLCFAAPWQPMREEMQGTDWEVLLNPEKYALGNASDHLGKRSPLPYIRYLLYLTGQVDAGMAASVQRYLRTSGAYAAYFDKLKKDRKAVHALFPALTGGGASSAGPYQGMREIMELLQ